MKKIRWGIIGCGDVTEVKSGPGFQHAEGSELVAVMRRNGDLAKDYAKRHHVPKWYNDAQALINDLDVDAVYVATPPSSHMEYVIACAKAGKPVYVEKPMARNYEECMKMIQACHKANVPLYVAYYRRALPRYLQVKQLVDEGAIGSVLYVTMHIHQRIREEEEGNKKPWRVIPEIAGGGKFMDLASHTIDLMTYILGPVTTVHGEATNQGEYYDAEDMVSAQMIFNDRIHGVGSWCFTAYDDEDMNEIIGTKGKIRFSTYQNEPIELITSEDKLMFDIKNPVHVQESMIQMVTDELIGKGKSPSTGITGAHTNWVMDQILESYRR